MKRNSTDSHCRQSAGDSPRCRRMEWMVAVLLLASASVQAQQGRYVSDWSDTAAWFTAHVSDDTGRVDVFYLVSTEVLAAADGGWRSALVPQDRAYMEAEMQYIDKAIFAADSLDGDQFNFYAPFYHQFTFASLQLPADSFDLLCRMVAAEVGEAFRYYMNHWNRGRRFVLMGFSQGAMFLTDLLESLSLEEYDRLVAAYLMGYRLTAEELSRPRVKAAREASETGVCISFNSVFDTAAAWPLVGAGATACINPVSWRVDDSQAAFVYAGDTLSVRVAAKANGDKMLLVDAADRAPFYQWMAANPYFGEAGASKDCLHHWDILFYNKYLRENVKLRSRQP